MADNYLEFSETIENLTPEEIEWWENEERRIDNALKNSCPEDVDDDNSLCTDFTVEEERCQIWFYRDEYGNPEQVANIVQKFLKRFRPNDFFSLTWAEWCSKPRIGEFGGGAVFVTVDKIKFYSTEGWVIAQTANQKQNRKE